MKEMLKKINVSLALALGQLALGLLLLINPAGVTSFVLIAVGILVIVLGGLHLFRYIRMPREEAAQTWKLASGVGLLALGIISIIYYSWVLDQLSKLTILYGGLTMASACMKLQLAVDELRAGDSNWRLMGISCLVSIVLGTVLFLQPFADTAIWIITGVMLVILAVVDGLHFVLGLKKKPTTGSIENTAQVQ